MTDDFPFKTYNIEGIHPDLRLIKVNPYEFQSRSIYQGFETKKHGKIDPLERRTIPALIINFRKLAEKYTTPEWQIFMTLEISSYDAEEWRLVDFSELERIAQQNEERINALWRANPGWYSTVPCHEYEHPVLRLRMSAVAVKTGTGRQLQGEEIHIEESHGGS